MSSLTRSGALKLYMRDTYALIGKAIVTEMGVDPKLGRYILLNQTHFHPQGGGQLSDLGKINEVAITHVSKMLVEEGNPRLFDVRHHYVSETDLFEVGKEVDYKVDRERRILAATSHSGGHLLAAVVEKIFPNLVGVNGHHYPGEARVEFKLKEGATLYPSKEEIAALVIAEYEARVAAEIPVIIDNESEERTVAFGEDDRAVPCGGTHVTNTRELPGISIRKIEVKKSVLTIGYNMEPTGK